MTGPRSIAIVLDTTAVTAWARGSVAVGELLAELDDEHAAAVLPLACLVEAAHKTGMLEQARLEMLVAHPAVFLLEDAADDWKALASTRLVVDRLDLASAAWLALKCEVDVMTSDPRWYSNINHGRNVLTFEP